MIEIYLLEQLAAFARHGTLRAAAEELHITQPALSRSMKKLEDEFGVSLFHRENSKISLNATGRVAAEYAQKVLAADQDMIDRVLFFDRSLRTISIGTCTPFPLWELMPALQDAFPDMAITSEMADDQKLLSGLRNRYYQLVILHAQPESGDFFCQRYLEERLYVTFPKDHPLAARESVSFSDLEGLTLLVNGNVGFWLDICRKHLNPDRLLVQKDLDAMGELVESSTLPFFNADSMMARGYNLPSRISVPIRDPDAHAVYYIASLSSEKRRYGAVFSSARESVLRKGPHMPAPGRDPAETPG